MGAHHHLLRTLSLSPSGAAAAAAAPSARRAGTAIRSFYRPAADQSGRVLKLNRLGSRRVAVAMASSSGGPVRKSDEEWRAVLSPEQFRILRMKGTEYPGTGEYDKFYEKGIYKCAGCGTPLYESTTKFNSGCGWPAFFKGLPGAIRRTVRT